MEVQDFLCTQQWIVPFQKGDMLALQRLYAFHALLYEALCCFHLDDRVLAFSTQGGEGGSHDATQMPLQVLICMPKKQPSGEMVHSDVPALLLRVCMQYYLVDHTAIGTISIPRRPSQSPQPGAPAANNGANTRSAEPPSLFLSFPGMSMRWWCRPLAAARAVGGEGAGNAANASASLSAQATAHDEAREMLIAAANAMGTHLRPEVLGVAESVARVLPRTRRIPAPAAGHGASAAVAAGAAGAAGAGTTMASILANKEEVRQAAHSWLILSQAADDAATPTLSGSDLCSALLAGAGQEPAAAAAALQLRAFPCDCDTSASAFGTHGQDSRFAPSPSTSTSTSGSSGGSAGVERNRPVHVPVKALRRIGKLARVPREPLPPCVKVKKKWQQQAAEKAPPEEKGEGEGDMATAILSCADAERIENTCNEALSLSKRRISDILDDIFDASTGSKRAGVDAHVAEAAARSLRTELAVHTDVTHTDAVLRALPRTDYFYEKV